jgi:hypothetical protein
MMPLKRFVLIWIWVIMFFVFIWIRLNDVYLDRYYHMALGSKLENNKPAGEIVAGFYMKQPINWNLFDKDVIKQDASSTVCVSMFLANYNNRNNAGTFALSLQVGGDNHRVVVDAKMVGNNKNHRICFEGLLFGDVAYKPTELILEGINSKKGKAITAWMTKDTVHGGAVLYDGSMSDRSLTFRIETIRNSSMLRIHAIILTLIYGLSSGLIFFVASTQSLNSCSKNNFIHKDNQ